MTQEQITGLVANFIGGFVMTWLRGYSWFGEGATYGLALIGGALATYLGHPVNTDAWLFGCMTNSLAVLGGVKVGGDLARARGATNLPAAVIPKYSELSDTK